MNSVMDRSLMDPGEFSLPDLVRPLARYYWVVLVTTAVCVISTLLFSYYQPVTYTATNLVFVGGAEPRLVVDLIKARNGQTVEVEELSGGLLILSFIAESSEEAVSGLGLLVERVRSDMVNLLPDYETGMLVAREEYDRLATRALNSGSTAESTYLTGAAAELTRIMFDLRAGELTEEGLLRVIEEPSVPSSAPRILPVHIVLAVVMGLVLGGIGVYIANARETIVERNRTLSTTGMVMGQPTQEIHPGSHVLYGAAQANGTNGNGNGGSASNHS